jgi:hypothetical protein
LQQKRIGVMICDIPTGIRGIRLISHWVWSISGTVVYPNQGCPLAKSMGTRHEDIVAIQRCYSHVSKGELLVCCREG